MLNENELNPRPLDEALRGAESPGADFPPMKIARILACAWTRFVCVGLGVFLCAGCDLSKKSEAVRRIRAAGGQEEVNQEARTIFKRFGTQKTKLLYDKDLKDFPAIASLGTGIILYGAEGTSSAHVSVRYGSHWQPKCLLIFENITNLNVGYTSELIPITTNILVRVPKRPSIE